MNVRLTTHKDWHKTGSLFAIEDINSAPAEDDKWFDYFIKVIGKRVIIKINGKVTVDYTEPKKPERPESIKGHLIDKGAN